jgi:hypothetical protein
MAGASLVSTPVYELKLSEREAKLIKNSLYNDYSDEPISERLDRENIFNALKNAGV